MTKGKKNKSNNDNGGRKVPEKMLLRLFLSTLNCDNAMLEDRDSQLIHEPTKVVSTKYSIHFAVCIQHVCN